MNHNSVKYFLFSIFFTFNLYSQNIPKVPETITLDNMVLRINKDVQSTIQSEVDALHANDKYFQIFIDRINIYFPIIENVLNDEGVPDDFKYLALQESALLPDAVSSSNAIGFWQFKLETAEDYGLVINENIDERKNIVSSTRAAARYIKNSNFIFENWIFSVLSYLMGLNGAKAEVDSKLYGAKRMSIDSNTHWYIIKFLAHKIAFEDFIDKKSYDLNYSIYNNQNFNNLDDLSMKLSVSKEEVKSLNKWITSDRIPNDREYAFLLPERKENLLKKIGSTISTKVESFLESNFKSAIDKKIINVVSKRIIYLNDLPAIIIDSIDNIDRITELYNISQKSFLQFNDINKGHKLILGLPYYFTKKRRKGKVEVYLRKENEDLWRISQTFGVQLKSLKKYNKNNKSDKILLRKKFIP